MIGRKNGVFSVLEIEATGREERYYGTDSSVVIEETNYWCAICASFGALAVSLRISKKAKASKQKQATQIPKEKPLPLSQATEGSHT
jgi:hypothetical protein